MESTALEEILISISIMEEISEATIKSISANFKEVNFHLQAEVELTPLMYLLREGLFIM
jgi:hypothetical protein